MNKEKLCSMILTSTILVLFILTSISAAVQEIQLTQNGSRASTPAIYGDKVVWADFVNDSGIIHLYNLTTSEDIQLESFHGSRPAIYGDKIVWRDYQICGNNENYNLSVYDISTAEKFQITKNVSEDSIPAIYEDKIVWHNSRNGVDDIYMYNLSTSTEYQITSNRVALHPAIYADRIVWTDYRNGNPNICMYNLSASKETQITDSEYPQLYPSIYGDTIVWAGDRGGRRYSLNSDIYMYNVSTSKITQITNSESASRPKIYKENIIWMDSRNGSWNIYMYNISTQEEFQVSRGESGQMWPAIYDDRIVWKDNRNAKDGHSDVYTCMASAVFKSPVANFSVAPDLGFSPLSVQFTDFSKNAILRSWDFNNDGVPESTEKNPVYVYTNPGNYLVNLTVSDINTTDSKLFTVLVFAEQLLDDQLVLTETQISTSGKATYDSPSIYDDKVVWIDHTGDYSGNDKYDICLYNTSTKRETRIHTTNGLVYGLEIYKDRIVWYEARNGQSDIYMYNISTSKETQITTCGTTSHPAIYEDRIVWADNRDEEGTSDIYMYNLSTSEESKIINDTSAVELDIYGDKIVWLNYTSVSYSNGFSNIYMYDLSTSKKIQITTSGSAGYPVAIYDDRIVWEDDGYEKRQIYVYNISDSTEIKITPDNLSQQRPDIYGDRIVWQDQRNGNPDIFMYNLSTQKEIQITTSRLIQDCPVIYGDRILWYDSRKYGSDIYMCTISLKEPRIPVANFSTNFTNGCAPLSVQFTDLSENATEWKWDFGDNTYSADRNPVHTIKLETIPSV
ncbi:PKD domain-containing protein [Methanosarcina horonobensis]|nr:PKD domain-containing protein [Methanosarcina horonobensis]